ncbi:hypothetical protein F511_01991 [Dorcoceras hygrometricum]|uniref:Uncharacterized protein n=1 Tax=Dorcoceras hygrometricum TaxID=472368 RepID=A0A2Z7ASY3_9LAMI|nr:hypothetical protein F511_01991 [Dorcoceras hygrometricum]
MDSCFLSSNSFTKTFHVLPPRDHAKHLPNQFQSRRLSISCSQSLQEQDGHLVNSDWRAFRARLVATERISPLNKPALTADQLLPIQEAKWAHPIHEAEKSCLVIATEKLDTNHIYRRTVILLLSSGPTGLIGLILNRPSFMSIKEMDSWARHVPGPLLDGPLFFGGPYEEGLFLVNVDRETDGPKKIGVFDEVMEGLCYGTRESVGCADSKLAEAQSFRFFDGYCSWERQELSDEINAGYWSLAACSPTVIGPNCVGGVGLWEEVNELLAQSKVC